MKVSDKIELLKVFTEEGKVVGYKDRETVHNELLLHNEVALWIINPKNKTVLLQKRSPYKKLNANKWAVCAGHVVMDETLMEALHKEAREELGLDLNKYSPQELVTVIRNEYCNYSFFHHYYIKADIPLSEYVIQEEELVAVKYFDYEELKYLVKSGDTSLALVWNYTYKVIFSALDEIMKSLQGD